MLTPSVREQRSVHERPVELLQRLIRFDTTNPPGNEAECIAFIGDVLAAADVSSTVLALDPARPNLIARLAGRGDAPPLLLQGHVDVVPAKARAWRYPPFEGRLAEGYVWGRGALDLKGGVVMMLAAMMRARAENLALPGDVILALTSDEESAAESRYGAAYLVEHHADLFRDVRYAIGEVGGFPLYVGSRRFYPIMVAEKQICWLRAAVRGATGHASLPVRGGAMGRLGALLQRLSRRRLPVHVTPVPRQMLSTMAAALPLPTGLVLRLLLRPSLTDRILDLLKKRGVSFDGMLHNTVTATVVRGGERVNVVPSQITLDLDGRLLPGQGPADLLAELRGVAGGDVEFTVISYDRGPAEPNMGLFAVLAGILRESDPEGLPVPMLLPATTDGRLFARLGIQTYGFLPMNLPPGMDYAGLVHGVDERIPVEALQFGTSALFKVLQRFGSALPR